MHTLPDQTDKREAVVPIKGDIPLAKFFPHGVPVEIPEGHCEPTLLVNGEEYYEILLGSVGDSKVMAIAQLYTSAEVPPLLSGDFRINCRALVPVSWIGVAA